MPVVFFYLRQLQSAPVAIDKPLDTCLPSMGSKFTFTNGCENATSGFVNIQSKIQVVFAGSNFFKVDNRGSFLKNRINFDGLTSLRILTFKV